MGAKKSPLPPVTIFGESVEAEQDTRILVRRPYRRKVQSGYVPLWNEFFRCYRQVGVDPLAAYLWAYLRQHEYDRPQWTAVADVSWPGRRDLADTLGRGQEVIGTLIQELRRAGLLWVQGVLPGFHDLAEAEHLSIEQVQDRAERVGVVPPPDGTLYRTADPLTRHEFALATQTRYCRDCKLYKRCEARIAADERLSTQQILPTRTRKTRTKPEVAAVPVTVLPPTEEGRRIQIATPPMETPAIPIAITQRSQIETEGRIGIDTPAVAKKTQPPLPNRHESMPDPQIRRTQPKKNPTKRRVVAVENFQPIAQPTTQSANEQHLVSFGFSPNSATQLADTIAATYQTDNDYVPRLIAYAQSHARTNPQGMVRRLIERGEDRVRPTAQSWQQTKLDTIFTSRSQNDITQETPQQYPQEGSAAQSARYSDLVCGEMDAISRKLGDGAHSTSNSVQALQLWHSSTLDEGKFVAEMRQVAARVKGGTGTSQATLFFLRLRQHLATVRRETLG